MASILTFFDPGGIREMLLAARCVGGEMGVAFKSGRVQNDKEGAFNRAPPY